jgi:hypothetical protein
MSYKRQINILFYCDDVTESWHPVSPLEYTKNVKKDANGGFSVVANREDNSGYRWGKHELGFGILKKQLEDYKSEFLKINVTVVNRFYEYDYLGNVVQAIRDPLKINKITTELLSPYDQIWIFGMKQGNNVSERPEERIDESKYTDPKNKKNEIDLVPPDWANIAAQELDTGEIAILEDWMDEGNGVLITGDHSNPANHSNPAKGKGTFWSLGRALGKDLRRANELRVWENGSGGGGDNPLPVVSTYNPNLQSISPDKASDRLADRYTMSWMPQQSDNLPQNVSFAPYRMVALLSQSHRLFKTIPSYQNNNTGTIAQLPDHGHEGMLNIPSDFSKKDKRNKFIWPTKNGTQPKPQIVAWGTDYNAIDNSSGPFKRFIDSSACGLVTAYDGQSVGVGNIVAHSTWHHFNNVNLIGFFNTYPDGKVEKYKPSAVLQNITDYYVNLANYLQNPNPKRDKSWLGDIIWDVVDLIPHPIPEEMTFNQPSVDQKNPIPNIETLAQEIGQLALNQISKQMSFVHFEQLLTSQVHFHSIEHGAGIVHLENMSLTMVLGEIVISASRMKAQNEKSTNTQDFIVRGIQKAYTNYIDMIEKPLIPLKNAVNSMQKQYTSAACYDNQA